MGNVLEDIAKMMEGLNKTNSAISLARNFGRKNKDSIYAIKNGCRFILDDKFVAGLKNYGYELKLVKVDRNMAKKFKVGDLVEAFGCKGVVLAIDGVFLWAIDEAGEVAEWNIKDCKKLNKHIDIQPIIDFAKAGA